MFEESFAQAIGLKKPVIPLFIQLPRENIGSIKNPEAYDEAYMSFEKQAKEIQRVMETCVELEVPSKADIDLGESWGG